MGGLERSAGVVVLGSLSGAWGAEGGGGDGRGRGKGDRATTARYFLPTD